MGSYGYDWQRIGLLIRTPAGTCWIQGEEGSELYDKLEELESVEQMEMLLSEYECVCTKE